MLLILIVLEIEKKELFLDLGWSGEPYFMDNFFLWGTKFPPKYFFTKL